MTVPASSTHATTPSRAPSHHVCPWWMGYLLLCPVRRLMEHPERLLGPHVSPGMRILDFGASMGYFSIAAARLVGPEGRVVCVDLAPRALATLRRRARRAGVDARIETVLSRGDTAWTDGRAGSFDLALAMHVVHELPDVTAGVAPIVAALRAGGRLLMAEPRGHVSDATFGEEVENLRGLGLVPVDAPGLRRAHTALFTKPGGLAVASVGPAA